MRALRVLTKCGVQGASRLLNHAHSLTVARMVSLPSQISAFCALAARSPCICSHLRVALRFAQQPTGLTLPSGALRVALGLRPKCPQGTCFPSRLPGFGAEPQSLMPQHFHERYERPKDTRNAAFSKFRGLSTVCARRPNGRRAQRVEKAGAARLFRHAVAGPGALRRGPPVGWHRTYTILRSPGTRRISHAAPSASANTASSQTSAAASGGSAPHSGRNSRSCVWAISQSCAR